MRKDKTLKNLLKNSGYLAWTTGQINFLIDLLASAAVQGVAGKIEEIKPSVDFLKNLISATIENLSE